MLPATCSVKHPNGRRVSRAWPPCIEHARHCCRVPCLSVAPLLVQQRCHTLSRPEIHSALASSHSSSLHSAPEPHPPWPGRPSSRAAAAPSLTTLLRLHRALHRRHAGLYVLPHLSAVSSGRRSAVAACSGGLEPPVTVARQPRATSGSTEQSLGCVWSHRCSRCPSPRPAAADARLPRMAAVTAACARGQEAAGRLWPSQAVPCTRTVVVMLHRIFSTVDVQPERRNPRVRPSSALVSDQGRHARIQRKSGA